MLALTILLSLAQTIADPVVDVRPTSLVRRGGEPDSSPLAVLDLRVDGARADSTIEVVADGVAAFYASCGARFRGLVPVPMPAEGQSSEITVSLSSASSDEVQTLTLAIPRPESDWTVWLVPGFHYDPVWWNTQAHYTETGEHMDPHVGPGLSLVEEHLTQSERDPDYVFAVHQLPYLKTFLEARPSSRARILAAVRAGRAGLVGGSYNEYSSTLVSLESSIRNAVYGTAFQRDVLGARSDSFWQCDVFGHAPSFPSVMADLGHGFGAFARGPFHQWGIDRDQVHFPSEFRWASPDGRSVLTHYMTGHYGVAYERLAPGKNRTDGDRGTNERILAELFEDLKRPAATKNVMLPMHMDFIRPLEDIGEIVRAWNERYASPRMRIDTSAGYFDAVAREVKERGIVLPVITRDMNPIYTGCAVSFADLKTSNRAAETAVRDAELWATCAWLEGAPFPWAAIDRAWRQLMFNAHHDGVTGSMSDQVYLDVMDGARDALEIAREVQHRALTHLGRRITVDWGARTTIAWNSTARPMTAPGWLAGPVPPVGWRRPMMRAEDRTQSATTIENEHLRVEIDLERGGAISRMFDKHAQRELLLGLGNDLLVLDEYPVLPGHGEGPWHLAPTGARRRAAGGDARVIERGRYRLTIEADDELFTKRQTLTLYPESRRLRVETTIEDWKGKNKLVRAVFPFDAPGARPVHETAGAVIGRPFARDVDVAEDPWTLDQACHRWVDLSSTCVVETSGGGRTAFGVADVVLPPAPTDDERRAANRFVLALARSGVTSTLREAGTRPYGDLAFDSNVPDLRIFLGRDRKDHTALNGAAISTVLVDVDDIRGACARLDAEHIVRVPHDDARLLGPPPPTHGVAVINRGPVSVHVSKDGTIGLNLMRSCTSWPSGLWIDAPDRRHPDGSPLGAMHGSHTFSYTVLPHEGDWRAAHVSRVAQEEHHDPAVTLEAAHEGVLPATGSFLEISEDDVLLLALKPAGFPHARWRTPPVSTGTRRTIVARLRNSSDREITTTLRTRHSLLAARTTNALEEEPSDGRALPVAVGATTVTLAPHAFATLLLDVEGAEVDVAAVSLDPVEGETAESAYWLENLGEGVADNGALSIVPDRREAALSAETELGVSIVNNRTDIGVTVPLRVEVPDPCIGMVRPDVLHLGPGEVGRATIRIVTRHGLETRVPSPVTITAGVAGKRTNEVTGTIWVHTDDARIDAPPVHLISSASMVEKGDLLGVTLLNQTEGPLPGVVTWLGPEASWAATGGRGRTRIRLEAEESREVTTTIVAAVDSYVVPKWSGGGRAVYGEPIRIVSRPDRVQLAFDTDRVRLSTDGPRIVRVTATSLSGLDDDSGLTLTAPDGFQVSRNVNSAGAGGRAEPSVTRRGISFEVRAAKTPARGTLTARGPNGALARVPYSVAPRVTARASQVDVSVDGRLDEWEEQEFIHATGPLSRSRGAVRWSESGLALAFDIEDDRFVQEESGSTIWKGDSVQWALSITPAEVAGYSGTDLEFGAALTPLGPRVWCWYGGEGGRTGHLANAPIAVRHEGHRLTYEIVIPRAALPGFALRAGAILGFSWIANDDDGDGYRGATEWTPGMTGTKDSSLFGELSLERK